MKNDDQKTIDAILNSVEGDVMKLTVGKILKTGQKDAFIPKGDLRKRFGLAAAQCNRVHFALKRMWGAATAKAERKSTNKAGLVLETVKHQANGKVIHTYAPIRKPKASKRSKSHSVYTKKNVITLLADKLGVDVDDAKAMLKAS